MVPLIDVIFLLLTFFIYSMITMIQANVLPVKLTAVHTGSHTKHLSFDAITIDRAGKFYWNRKPVTSKQLDAKLASLGQKKNSPPLYLAMQRSGGRGKTVDRGPLLMRLVEQIRQAGITNFSLVGPPHGS